MAQDLYPSLESYERKVGPEDSNKAVEKEYQNPSIVADHL